MHTIFLAYKCLSTVNGTGGDPIEKPVGMQYYNLLCLRRIGLLVYVCSVSKNKITKLYAKKFDWLVVNDDKIVN